MITLCLGLGSARVSPLWAVPGSMAVPSRPLSLGDCGLCCNFGASLDPRKIRSAKRVASAWLSGILSGLVPALLLALAYLCAPDISAVMYRRKPLFSDEELHLRSTER